MEHFTWPQMDPESLQSTRQVFRRLAESNDDLTIDMSEVNYIDGAGIGALMYVFRRARAKRVVIKIVNLTGQPKQLFERLRLISVTRLQVP